MTKGNKTFFDTTRPNVINIRINDIAFQANDKTLGKFVKYSTNQYFGKLKQYLWNGWEEKQDCLVNKDGGCSISKNLFYLPEIVYTIAFLEYNKQEDDFNLRTVGSRLLDVFTVKHSRRQDFGELYALAQKQMMDWIDKENRSAVISIVDPSALNSDNIE